MAIKFMGCFILVYFSNLVYGSINLTTESTSLCPTVIFTCTAENLPSTTLGWFFDRTLFAEYSLGFSPDVYPFSLSPSNSTIDRILGGVNISILNANRNENRGNFLSNMTLNISALQEVGISEISCGDFILNTAVAVVYDFRNVPSAPVRFTVQPEYNADSNLAEITFTWDEVISSDEYCVYLVNYTITLEDVNSDLIVHKMEVGFEACHSGVCSTILIPSLPESNQSLYRANIVATNRLGSSVQAISNHSIYNSIKNLFSQSVQTINCITSVRCSSSLNGNGNCTIRYRKLSDQNLSTPITSIFNSTSNLQIESDTTYFFKIIFSLNSELVILKMNHTTENGPSKLSSGHIFISFLGITMVSIILLAAAISIIAILIKRRNKAFIFMLCTITLAVLALVFWIAVLTVIDQQGDTCASQFVLQRESLVYSSFVFSVFTLIFGIIMFILAARIYNRVDKYNIVTAISKGSSANNNSNIGDDGNSPETKELDPVVVSDDKVKNLSSKESKSNIPKCQISVKSASETIQIVSDVCRDCTGYFSPTTAKQSYCHACGKIVCDSCSEKKLHFQDQDKTLNVCENCYKKYNEQEDFILLERNLEGSIYYYSTLIMRFFFDKGILKFLEDEKHILKEIDCRDIQMVEVSTERPTILNCLKLSFADSSEMISLSSSTLRNNWIRCIESAARIPDELQDNGVSAAEKQNIIIFAESVMVKFISKETKNWNKNFLVWTSESVDFFTSIMECSSYCSVKLINIDKISPSMESGEEKVIQVKGELSFDFQVLSKTQQTNFQLAEIFRGVVHSAKKNNELK